MLIFATPILVGEVIIRNNENEYSYKNRYINENGDSIKTLILGTSRSYGGIDPCEFQNHTFNMANSAQTLDVDYMILERYLEQLPNLDCVILELSYFTFRNKFKSADDWFYTNYKVFMNLSNQGGVANTLVSQCLPLYKNYLKKIYRGTNMRCNEFGQGNYYKLEDKTHNCNKDGLKKVKGYNSEDATAIPKNVEQLHKIASFCDDHNLKLILVTLPVWHTFYDNIEPTLYVEMQSLIDATSLSYDLEYYNFIGDQRFYKTDDYFMDGHHLTDVGAKEFTKILVDTLQL